MADVKVSAFTDGNPPVGSDILGLSRGGASNVRATLTQLMNALAPVRALGQGHVAASKSDADTAQGTLATLTIPGGTMGANDSLRVTAKWSYPSSATNKQLRMRLGGSNIGGVITATTTTSCVTQVLVSNRNSVSSQVVGQQNSAGGFGTASAIIDTTAINMAVNQDVTFVAQWGTAGAGSNNITLESYLVELIRAAT